MATRAGLMDGQYSTADLMTIDFSDHHGCIICCDLHKTEAAHPARIEVTNEIHGFHTAVLTE